MFEGDIRVHIVDWEIKHDKPTPTIATLRRFKAENPDIIPVWLMGMDSFSDMPNWVEYPKHQQLCNVAVFSRKGHQTSLKTNCWQLVEAGQLLQQTGHVCWLDVDLPNISASQIRQNPQVHQQDLHQDTCNAIVSCYASD